MVREMKHTEIGDIPNNWVTMSLNDFCIIKDGTHGTYNRKKDGCLLLSAKNVFDNYLNVSKNESYISESDYFFITQNGFPQKGDILFSCVGSIGRCCIFDGLIRAAFQRSVAFIRTNDSVDNRYLMYAIQGSRCQSQIQQLVSASTQGGLYLGAIGQIVIAIPPIDEQKVIAQALTEIDNLILSEEKVIKKIKTMKSGCLSLMYPKYGKSVPEIRLSGFTDPWEQRKLGEYCEMYNGDRSAKYPSAGDMVDEGIPFINAGDLENGIVNIRTCNKITREKYDELGGAKLQLGDIVYCLRGTLGKNAFIDNFHEGTVASSLVAIRPKKINGRYLYYILNSDVEYRQRVVRDEGAAQPNLSAQNVSEYVIPLPPFDEQECISTYFSNLDHFITLHQHKLEKYKAIKQGMMNELLTGKIRLV